MNLINPAAGNSSITTTKVENDSSLAVPMLEIVDYSTAFDSIDHHILLLGRRKLYEPLSGGSLGISYLSEQLLLSFFFLSYATAVQRYTCQLLRR